MPTDPPIPTPPVPPACPTCASPRAQWVTFSVPLKADIFECGKCGFSWSAVPKPPAAAVEKCAMVYRPRSRRVALLGARVQLAITIANVMDMSRTGVRIRASHQWRAGSEWPLVLEWPAAAPMRVIGRVARCEPADVSLPNDAVVQNRYQLAFTFVDLSTEAAAVLALVCGTAVETGERTG